MRTHRTTAENYQCETTSVAGFVQQLAVGYVARGYWFYVVGHIPEGKDPRAVDAKLVLRYGIAVSKWGRARRRRRGAASVQYLRLGRVFILAATHGRHAFFDQESSVITDIRRVPLKFAGYSIGYSGTEGSAHASVRIDSNHYALLRKHFDSIALRPSSDIMAELGALPFEPYAPVRNQLSAIIRSVNRLRKAASLDAIPKWAVRRVRRPVKVFCCSQKLRDA